MLGYFICGLEPRIGHEVFNENPQNLKEACSLVERISNLANLVGGGSTCGKF